MKEYKGIERRKYIRLGSVFPVQFKLISLDGTKTLSDLEQGFTTDVSKGGILLRINNIDPKIVRLLEKREAKVLLDIAIPVALRPIEAVSTVAWINVIKEEKGDLCMIGLSFESIEDKDRKRLIEYALSLYRTPKLMAAALLLLLLFLGISRIGEISLRRENAILVGRLIDVLEQRTEIVEILDDSGRDKSVLLDKLKKSQSEMAEIEEKRQRLIEGQEEAERTAEDVVALKEDLGKSKNMLATLESQLARISENRKDLQRELDTITSREEKRIEELEVLEKTRLKLEKATVDNMYNWLKVHQNKRTGLIASYEGDSKLKNTAFTYDQSLVAQTFLLNNDIESAKSVLDFFKYRAKRHTGGGFVNAYGVNRGVVAEYIVHNGPNIWVGIALMQYMDKTGSDEYLDLAEDIAGWVMKFQSADPGGGIRGGPNDKWFSTEHNLDAYAFFTMLAQKTDKDIYKRAARKSLSWIKDNAYSASEGIIYRGKGDSTIATDTFAWAIAAIGPRTLIDEGMDPYAIMKYAEDHCKVKVTFLRPDKKIFKITGFDFARHKHLGRGGLVSSEWTAQMIVSFKMMSDFCREIGDIDKAKAYQDKYNFYIKELEKMIITSPSRSGQGAGCLLYATQDNVDTGHGWRTPRGRNTGSVSGTAYGIFAIKAYNPLKLTRSK